MVCFLKSSGPNQADAVWAVHDPKAANRRPVLLCCNSLLMDSMVTCSPWLEDRGQAVAGCKHNDQMAMKRRRCT